MHRLRRATARLGHRLTRRTAVLLACLLLSLSMIASSQITSHSGAVVETAVEENWRGHYDLLVTADGELTEAAEQTGGLIEQNFASLTSEGAITEAQLESVRDMPEVEVAAPLAFVAQFSNPAFDATLGVSLTDWEDSEFFERPRAFEGALTTYLDDGMQRYRLLSHERLILSGVRDHGEEGQDTPTIFLYDIDDIMGCDWCDPLYEQRAAQGDVIAEDAGAQRRMIYETYTVVPELHSGMVAVDPAAERLLLGETGHFLDPLVVFDDMQGTLDDGPCDGEPEDNREPGECLADLVDADRYPQVHEQVFHGNRHAEGESPREDAEPQGPILPIIFSETEYPDLIGEADFPELEVPEGVEVEEIAFDYGHWGDITSYADNQGADQLGGTPVAEVHLTEDLVPLVPEFQAGFGLAGEDAPLVPQTGGVAGTSPMLPGGALRHEPDDAQLATAPEGVALALVNESQGYHVTDAELTSREARYRMAQRATQVRPPPGALLAPVGSYRPGETGAEDEASYVPLGLYAEAEATIAQPGEYEGQPLPPSFSGRGSLLNSPGVITTMAAYEQYRGEPSADIIRVRVAGVDNYSAENLDRIEAVAEQIGDLGLDVQVVAGSSLAPVGIYLPEYFYDDGADLGWTVEEWTSLGAAAQVEQAQMAASWVLLIVALAGVTVLACAVQLAGLGPRRRESALLLSLGWTRGRIRRWFLTEDLAPMALVVVACVIAVAVSTTAIAQAASLVGGAAFVLVVLIGAMAVTGAATRRSRRALGSGNPASNPVGIGRRTAASSPGAAALGACSLLVLVTTAIAFAVVILTARDQAGVTRIAGVVNAEVLLPQAVLAVGAVVAGVILFAMGIRQTLRQALPQHRMLITAGWPLQALTSSIRAQLLASLMPGLLLGLVAGIAVVIVLGDQTAVLALVIGVATGFAVLVALVWAGYYARRLFGQSALA